MAFKLTYLYALMGQRTAGWSETFYSDAYNLDEAENQAQLFRNVLAPIHGKQTVMMACRISDLVVKRRVRLLEFPIPADFTNNTAAEILESDYPTIAILLQSLGTTTGRITRQWIKGIKDDQSIRGGVLNKAVGWGKMRDFLAFLNTPANGLRARSQSTETVRRPVNALDDDTGTFTAPGGHPYVQGDVVRVIGVRGWSYPNGQWRVLSVAGNTFTVGGWNPPVNRPVPNLAAAKVYLYTPETYVAAWDVVRISSRRVGRPFGSPSGRQRTKR